MTPKDYALLALKCYADAPTFGAEDSAARAVVYGDVVAIPGTNNISCDLADMQAIATSTPLGMVHDGFWETWCLMANNLMPLSPEAVTGHSLGGDLALIYAGMLCLAGKPPKAVYAFEPAHVSCDTILRELFIKHGVFVYVSHHGHDIVPCIARLFEKWQHPGDVTELCQTDYPYPHISFDAVRNIKDHLMDGVIAALG